ncbi:MAG: hypothetical protein ACYCWW_15875, partial [Deltaproteobacteria bacterium]
GTVFGVHAANDAASLSSVPPPQNPAQLAGDGKGAETAANALFIVGAVLGVAGLGILVFGSGGGG